jgi:hypothetical protein
LPDARFSDKARRNRKKAQPPVFFVFHEFLLDNQGAMAV